MKSGEIRRKFLLFFEKRKHAIIPSASLVPENDPSVLFTTAGMHPLVPYLLGETHPAGTRLVNSQKCVRTVDIDDIGDNRHLTFFEMLGNWSLGNYFKKESIAWSMEFLTSKKEGLGLDPERMYVTVFKGEDGIPRDEESIEVWKKTFADYGIKAEVANRDTVVGGDIRIIPLGIKDNFWIAGVVGPCGGDTEIFYDTKPESGKLEGPFETLVNSFRVIEIWNNVFMEFNKTAIGKYENLKKRNVDTGMGLERITAAVNGKDNVFDTDMFDEAMEKIDHYSKKEDGRAKRIIADHVRTSIFLVADGVIPANTDRGYVLRRLIRRAVRYSNILGLPRGILFSGIEIPILPKGITLFSLADIFIEKYKEIYPNLKNELIKNTLTVEEEKFRKTIELGMREFEKIKWDHSLPSVGTSGGHIFGEKNVPKMSGEVAFNLYQTYGFPIELTIELAGERGAVVDLKEFEAELKKHQDVSKIGAEQRFKGGLADHSGMSVKYHTATHLLHKALREVLGTHVFQRGSNITPERLRFDFSFDRKMTNEEKKAVEDLVNQKVAESLPVSYQDLPIKEAEKLGAIGLFEEKYGDNVRVYKIGDFSLEFCGGPHILNTSELGHFKITKEEACSAGVRRIKAVLN